MFSMATTKNAMLSNKKINQHDDKIKKAPRSEILRVITRKIERKKRSVAQRQISRGTKYRVVFYSWFGCNGIIFSDI